MKIQFLKIEDGKLPFKATEGAACADVIAREIIDQDDYKMTIKLGFATAIPKGYKGVIVPRSSFTQKGWVMQNSPAQIDADYRGEWMLKFEAIDYSSNFPYKKGERVAQIFFEKILDYEVEGVNDLPETERGQGGFGSTGI